MADSLAAFFTDNETKTNRLLARAISYSLFIFVLVIMAGLLDFFPKINKTLLVTVCLVDIFIDLFVSIYSRKHSDSPNLRYVVVFASCLLNVFLSSLPTMRMYISFLLPPLISCLYVDEKFTHKVCIASFFSYELSIAIRSFVHEGAMFAYVDRLPYFLAFALGGFVEYGLYTFILLQLTRIAYRLLTQSFLRMRRVKQIHNLVLEGFATIVESKDKSTGEHITRTSLYVQLIARKLQERGLYPEEVNDHTIPVMVRAAPFHDMGKISVPDEILNKPGKLDKNEWTIVQRHPAEGALFIRENFKVLEDQEFVDMAASMALHHHEHVDGTGYPLRLVQDEIPVNARIMSAADVMDALVSKRSYKQQYSVEKAFEILKEMSGTTLDPVIVDIVMESRPEIEAIIDSTGGAA